MKNQAMIFFSFLLLAMTCISCSSNRVTSADDQLLSEEGVVDSDSVSEGDVSEATQERADALLDGESTNSLNQVSEVQLDADPLAMGMESSGGFATLDSAADSSASTILAQADTAPVQENSPSLFSAPAVEFGAGSTAPEATFSDSTFSDSPAPVKKHIKKAVKPVVAPKPERTVHEEVSDPFAEDRPVAQADVNEALEPIPAVDEEKAEPQLASAEISTFIERHVFLVTVGVVGFVFALFIIMRRNKGREDNLTL